MSAQDLSGGPAEVAPFKLSEEFGTVEEFFRGSGDSFVVYVQDAHANLSAQKSIASTLEFLIREQGFRLVGQEAGTGKVDVRLLRAFPIREAVKRVMEGYLHAGEIGGPEYLAATSPEEFDFVGVDEQEKYLSNLKQFFLVLDRRKPGLESIKKMRTMLKSIQDSFYSKPHRELNEIVLGHEQGRLSLHSLILFLEKKAAEEEIQLTSFNELTKVLRARISNEDVEGVNPIALKQEIERLTFMLRKRLAASELELTLVRFDEFVSLTEHGLNLELSKSEVNRLRELRKEFSREHLGLLSKEIQEKQWAGKSFDLSENFISIEFLDAIFKFYEIACERDEIFVRELLKKMRVSNSNRAVLVTGGFHRRGITEKLRKKNISYTVVSPKIQNTASHEEYIHLMERSRRLLSLPERNTLGYPLALADSNPDRSRILAESLSRIARVSRSSALLEGQSMDGVRDQFLENLSTRDFDLLGIGGEDRLSIVDGEGALAASSRWFERIEKTGITSTSRLRSLLVSAVHRFASVDVPDLLKPSGFGASRAVEKMDWPKTRDVMEIDRFRNERSDELIVELRQGTEDSALGMIREYEFRVRAAKGRILQNWTSVEASVVQRELDLDTAAEFAYAGRHYKVTPVDGEYGHQFVGRFEITIEIPASKTGSFLRTNFRFIAAFLVAVLFGPIAMSINIWRVSQREKSERFETETKYVWTTPPDSVTQSEIEAAKTFVSVLNYVESTKRDTEKSPIRISLIQQDRKASENLSVVLDVAAAQFAKSLRLDFGDESVEKRAEITYFYAISLLRRQGYELKNPAYIQNLNRAILEETVKNNNRLKDSALFAPSGFGAEPNRFDVDAEDAVRQDQKQAAMDLAQVEVKRNPDSAHTWQRYIHLLFMAGRMIDVIAVAHSALVLHPRNVNILVHLARALYKEGKFREAEQRAREVLEMGIDLDIPYSPLDTLRLIQDAKDFNDMQARLIDARLKFQDGRGWLKINDRHQAEKVGVYLYDRRLDYPDFYSPELEEFIHRALQGNAVVAVIRSDSKLEGAVAFRRMNKNERRVSVKHSEGQVRDGVIIDKVVVTDALRYSEVPGHVSLESVVRLFLNIAAQISSFSTDIAPKDRGTITVSKGAFRQLELNPEEESAILMKINGMRRFEAHGRKGFSYERYYLPPEDSIHFQWENLRHLSMPFIGRPLREFTLTSGYEQFSLELKPGRNLAEPLPIQITSIPAFHDRNTGLIVIRTPVGYKLYAKRARENRDSSISGNISEQITLDKKYKLWIFHLAPKESISLFVDAPNTAEDHNPALARIWYTGREKNVLRFVARSPYETSVSSKKLSDHELSELITVPTEVGPDGHITIDQTKDERYGPARALSDFFLHVMDYHLKEGNFGDMIPLGWLMIQLNPKNPYGWGYLAKAYRAFRNFEFANRIGAVAVKRFPKNPVLRIGYAAGLYKSGFAEEALKQLDINELPELIEHRKALTVMSQSLLTLGRKDEARKILQDGQSRFPSDTEFPELIRKLDLGMPLESPADTGRHEAMDDEADFPGVGFGAFETFDWNKQIIDETTEPDDFLLEFMERLEVPGVAPQRIVLTPIVIPFSDSIRSSKMDRRMSEWQQLGLEQDSARQREVLDQIFLRLTQKKGEVRTVAGSPRDRLVKLSEPIDFYGKKVIEFHLRVRKGMNLGQHESLLMDNPNRVSANHSDAPSLQAALSKHEILGFPLVITSDFQRTKLVQKLSSDSESVYKNLIVTEEEIRGSSGFGENATVMVDEHGFYILDARDDEIGRLTVQTGNIESFRRNWDPQKAFERIEQIRRGRDISELSPISNFIGLILEDGNRIFLFSTGLVADGTDMQAAQFLRVGGVSSDQLSNVVSKWEKDIDYEDAKKVWRLLRANGFYEGSDGKIEIFERLVEAIRQLEVSAADYVVTSGKTWMQVLAWANSLLKQRIDLDKPSLDTEFFTVMLFSENFKVESSAQLKDKELAQSVAAFLIQVSMVMMSELEISSEIHRLEESIRKSSSPASFHTNVPQIQVEVRTRIENLKSEREMRKHWRTGPSGFGKISAPEQRGSETESQIVKFVLSKVRQQKTEKVAELAGIDSAKVAVLSDLDSLEKLEKALASKTPEIRRVVQSQMNDVESIAVAWDTSKLSVNESEQLKRRIGRIFGGALLRGKILIAENDQKYTLLREAYGAALLGKLTQYLLDHVPPAVLESMDVDYLSVVSAALYTARIEEKLVSIAA